VAAVGVDLEDLAGELALLAAELDLEGDDEGREDDHARAEERGDRGCRGDPGGADGGDQQEEAEHRQHLVVGRQDLALVVGQRAHADGVVGQRQAGSIGHTRSLQKGRSRVPGTTIGAVGIAAGLRGDPRNDRFAAWMAPGTAFCLDVTSACGAGPTHVYCGP